VTRGEALDLLLQGKRLNAITQTGDKAEIWIAKDCLMVASRNVTGGWNLCHLLTMTDFELVPEPDTFEKIVRDLKAAIELHGCNHVSYEALYSLHCRATDVLAQMDGEK